MESISPSRPRSDPVDVRSPGWALTVTSIVLYVICWFAALQSRTFLWHMAPDLLDRGARLRQKPHRGAYRQPGVCLGFGSDGRHIL
jgi:hypothetical protein